MSYRVARLRVGRFVSFLLCVAFVIIEIYSLRRMPDRRRWQSGNLTAQQAFARTQSVCLLWLPRTQSVYMTAEYGIFSTLKSQYRYWFVNCQDAGGKDLANFRWDDDTGELLLADRSFAHGESSANSHVDLQEALQIAHRWLRLLRPNIGTGWRMDTKAKLIGSQWIVYAVRDQRRMFLALNASTGTPGCIRVF